MNEIIALTRQLCTMEQHICTVTLGNNEVIVIICIFGS